MNKLSDSTISKRMSYILRHNPKGYIMDKHGYISSVSLCEGLNVDLHTLHRVIDEDDKKRYSFNQDGGMVKANQGHSIDIDLGLESIKPLCNLYHGSSTKSFHLIEKDGIKPMNRHHVHLSESFETARVVGKRHGVSIIYKINTMEMYRNGCRFYISDNGVWLTNMVHFGYVSLMYINGVKWNKM